MKVYLKSLAIALFALVMFIASDSEATLIRLDCCGGQFAPALAIPIPKNSIAFTVIARGDGMDRVDAAKIVAPGGVTVREDPTHARSAGGGVQTTITLLITAGPGAVVATGTVILPILPFGTDTFKIKVVDVASISGLSMAPSIPAVNGPPATLTVAGTGVNNLVFSPAFLSSNSGMTNVQKVAGGTSGSQQFTMVFTTTNKVTFTTVKGGHSFIDTRIVHTSAECKRPGGDKTLNVTPAFADVVPVQPLQNVLTFTLGSETCGNHPGPVLRVDPTFCNLVPAPTQANPETTATIAFKAVVWGVKNTSGIAITTPFKIQLKFGLNVLDEKQVNSLAANASASFKFTRPEAGRKIMRNFNCANCYDLDEAPFNWRDPRYTVVVDSSNVITEGTSGEANNSFTIP